MVILLHCTRPHHSARAQIETRRSHGPVEPHPQIAENRTLLEKQSHAKDNQRVDDESVGMAKLPKKIIPRLQVRNGAPTPPEVQELTLVGLMSLSQNCVQIKPMRTQGRFIPQDVVTTECAKTKGQSNRRPTHPWYYFQNYSLFPSSYPQSIFLVYDKRLLETYLATPIARKHNIEKQGTESRVHGNQLRQAQDISLKYIGHVKEQNVEKKVGGKSCCRDLPECD